MRILQNVTTGLLYRNPIPHVQSRHAYFPSVAVFPDGGLAVFMIRHDRTGRPEDGLTHPDTRGFA